MPATATESRVSHLPTAPKRKREKIVPPGGLAGIGKVTLQRLMRRSGILRPQKSSHYPLRMCLTGFMETLMRRAHAIAANSKRKTVARDDVLQALEDMGMPYFGPTRV